jgi:hypothetical protein
MLSPETIDYYRNMPLGEKLKLVLEMSQEAEKYLLMGTPEEVDRKFELIRRENDLRNENILQALARLPKAK